MSSPAPAPVPKTAPEPYHKPPEPKPEALPPPPTEITLPLTEKVKAFAKEHKLPLVGVGCLIAGFLMGYYVGDARDRRYDYPPPPSGTVMENQFGVAPVTRRLDHHQEQLNKFKNDFRGMP